MPTSHGSGGSFAPATGLGTVWLIATVVEGTANPYVTRYSTTSVGSTDGAPPVAVTGDTPRLELPDAPDAEVETPPGPEPFVPQPTRPNATAASPTNSPCRFIAVLLN